MAKVRNVSGETRVVPELMWRHIDPDEVVDVPDDRVEGYTCQEAVWELVEGEG